MEPSIKNILFLQRQVAYHRDEQAYRELFFCFQKPLYRFANNIVRNGEVADEIVSDVMMKVWSIGIKLAEIEKLNNYLFTSIRNASITYLNKNRLKQVSMMEPLEYSFIDNSYNPERKIMLTEIEQKIEVSVSRLPRHCQKVYRMVKEDGFSHKDVCKILEITQNTVESHMRIALRRIRLELDDYAIVKKGTEHYKKQVS